ncbi:MAG: helix-turn-helix domain-containing protein [Clostridia bacterium]|nr:helix-turn-helix domain-containing protein [Clostridia bacterium]
MDRLTRSEAADFIGCSKSKLYSMEKAGFLKGTYYQIGRRRFYITEKLENWMKNGGEAREIEEKILLFK